MQTLKGLLFLKIILFSESGSGALVCAKLAAADKVF